MDSLAESVRMAADTIYSPINRPWEELLLYRPGGPQLFLEDILAFISPAVEWINNRSWLKLYLGFCYAWLSSPSWSSFLVGCTSIYITSGSWMALIICIVLLRTYYAFLKERNAHSADVEHISSTAPSTVVESHHVVEYLGQTFQLPCLLMQGMAAGNFSLIGPRALPMFFKQSEIRQPWDFAAYDSAYCVGHAMNVLEDCGVVWDDAFDVFREMEQPKKQYFEMTLEDFRRYRVRAMQQSPGRAVSYIIRKIHRALRSFEPPAFKISLSDRAALVITQHTDAMNWARVRVISGTITAGGKKQLVRLVFGAGLSPIDIVMRFQTSAFQCWISAYGAAHLYYARTRLYFGWLWLRNHPVIYYNKPIEKPFKSRLPWILKDSPLQQEKVKHITGLGSKLILFRLSLDQHKDIVAARKRELIRLRWEEIDGQTVLLRAHHQELQLLLAAPKINRTLYEHVLTEDMNQAIETACNRTVFFDPDTEHMLPDEMSGI